MSKSNKNIESSKLPGIYLKDWWRQLFDGYVTEKLGLYKMADLHILRKLPKILVN